MTSTPIKEAQYPVSEIMASCKKTLGVNPEVLAGALHGQSGDSFTISEYKALVKKFLERKV